MIGALDTLGSNPSFFVSYQLLLLAELKLGKKQLLQEVAFCDYFVHFQKIYYT